MKLLKKALAIVLASVMCLSLNVAVLAEEGDTAADFYEATLTPENYAGIVFDVPGYSGHPNGRPIEAYYNTRYPSNALLLAEYVSMITSYKVPVKSALSGITMNWKYNTSGLTTSRTLPIFYDLNRFAPEIADGVYQSTDSGYTAIADYSKNYWPASGYSYTGTSFASQLAANESTDSSDSIHTYDLTETVMAKYTAADCSSEYITLATGRETSEYSNSSFYMHSDEYMPSLTVKYRTQAILDYINAATEDSISKVINDIGAIGVLSGGTTDYQAYTLLSDAAKKTVGKNLLALMPDNGFATISAVAAAFGNAMNLPTVTFTVSPENYAIVFIDATDGASGNTSTLDLHYNMLYSGSGPLRSTRMSIITGFEVPLKEYVTNLKANYSFTNGNAANGRTQPFFYDLNRFALSAEAGLYDSTTAAYTEATKYTNSYWGTGGSLKTAYEFTYADAQVLTDSAKSLDITNSVLGSLKAAENNYLTLATGQANSTYLNYLFAVNKSEGIPTLTLTYLEADLLNAINAATEDNIASVLDQLAKAGAFSETQSGADLYLGLTPSGKKEIGKNLLRQRPEAGFASLTAVQTAWDLSMTLEKIETEISPSSYAVVYTTTTSGSYGYGSYHDNSIAKQTGGDLMKTYVNKWEMTDFTKKAYANLYTTKTIAEFQIPFKGCLSEIKANYELAAVQNGNKTGYSIDFATKEMSLSKVPAVYQASYDDFTSATNEQFQNWYRYATSADWQKGPQNVQDNFVPSSKAFEQTIDLTDCALKNFKASSSDYITTRAGGASIYDGWRITNIPTVKLAYTASSVLDCINSASDTAALLDELGLSGLLNASKSGYEGYKGLNQDGKQNVAAAVGAKLQTGGYASYAEFITAYDKAVESYVNNAVKNPSVNISFDNGNVSNTGTNSAVVPTLHGTPTYVTGANGSKALSISNTFGQAAQNYLDLGEYKFNNNNFSIVFWMRAVNAGIGEFGHDAENLSRCSADAVDFSKNTYTLGGVALANKNFSENDKTGFAMTVMPAYADFGVNMKIGENEVCNTTQIDAPVESRWHQIAYVVDRNGSAVTYVDNKAVSAYNIAASEGSIDAENAHLLVGADGLGQYGMISGEFDDIKIYPFALATGKLEEMYYETMLNKVNYEAETMLASDNAKYYSEENKTALNTLLTASKEYAGNYTLGATAELKEKYNSFNAAYDAFLNKDSKGAMLFTSDIHIAGTSDEQGNGLWMKKSLQQHEELGIDLKTWVNSGDYSDTGNGYQHIFFDLLAKNIPEKLNAVIARGNHDEPQQGSRKDESGNNIILTRDELREEFQQRMKPYFDFSDGINKNLLAADKSLNEPYYYLNDGMAHYIVIDNYDGGRTMWISPEQFVWLEDTLNAISGDGKPIFVVQHLPITGSVGDSVPGYPLNKEDGDKLVALLNRYDNIFLLNGHTHNGLGGATNTAYNFGNFWQINMTSFGQGSIKGFTGYGVGFYVNVYQDKIVCRARDFKNDEWLRDYDMSFDLKPASKTTMQRIELSDAITNYASVAETNGKTITVSVPVHFMESSGNYKAILAQYADNKLISTVTADVNAGDTEIRFQTTVSQNTTEMKILVLNTLSELKPLCTFRARQ